MEENELYALNEIKVGNTDNDEIVATFSPDLITGIIPKIPNDEDDMNEKSNSSIK